MDPLENPYRPGAGTSPPALIGRDELINNFAIAVRRTLGGRPGKSVMPIGLRGVGKTVLLNRFADLDHTGIEVGVWGRRVPLDHPLRDQDRVEVYRPLLVDPKVARRQRFVKQGSRRAGLFVKKRVGAKPGY